jgi:triosephosphate isomerase
MHKTIMQTKEFIQQLSKKIPSPSIKVGLAVPFTALSTASEISSGKFLIGVQNISPFKEGAYTGEISTPMVKDAGGTFSLIGHSERRRYYHEDDLVISQKVQHCLSEGVKVVLCIGETEEEHALGKTRHVLREQLQQGLKGLSVDEASLLVIAYEPVWAIGTGKSATAELAQETHRFCRSVIAEAYDAVTAERIPIIYGGSVTVKTIKELIQQPDIDGALVGGASLDVESFATIVNFSTEVNL